MMIYPGAVPFLLLAILFLPLPFIRLPVLFTVLLAVRPHGEPSMDRVPAARSSRPILLRGPPL